MRKTWALVGFSSAAVLALAMGCATRSGDGSEGATADLVGSPDLVISQVYGGGGNTDATFNHDFVELFNRGKEPVNLNGKALQYIASGNNFKKTTSVLPLPNVSLAPGRYYLVQLGTNDEARGAPLPAPDFVAGAAEFAMSVDKGKVALVSTETPLDECGHRQTPCAAGSWIDLVGYGGASQGEGTTTGMLNSKTAAIRKAGGCSDTNDNAADFEVATPAPRNGATAVAECPTANSADGGSEASTDGSAPETDGATGEMSDLVLLNEIKINPPGNQDTPWEYAEILCKPNASLKGYYFVAIEGDGDSTGGSPGSADIVVDLGEKPCGANGIVLIKAKTGGHDPESPQTSIITTTALETSSLENATTSFVIIRSPSAPIVKDTDYDPTNSGTLTLPDGASVIDGVSTFDQGDAAVDQTYAPRLVTKGSTPADAAVRIPGNTKAMSLDAWYAADLSGTDPSGLALDATKASANLPASGWKLTPGAPNVQRTDTPDNGNPKRGDGGASTTSNEQSDEAMPEGEGSYTSSSSSGSSSTRRATNTTTNAKKAASSDCSVGAVGGPSRSSFGWLAALGLGLAAIGSRRSRRR